MREEDGGSILVASNLSNHCRTATMFHSFLWSTSHNMQPIVRKDSLLRLQCAVVQVVIFIQSGCDVLCRH